MFVLLLVACDTPTDTADTADTADTGDTDTGDTADTGPQPFFDEPFDTMDTRRWLPADWKLGDTQFDPFHGRVVDGGLNLVHESDGAGAWLGAEFYTSDLFRGGMFSARVFGPKGPGTVCAFFFYGEADGVVNELDIELLDGAAWFSVYRNWTEADGYEESATHTSTIWPFPDGFDVSAAHEWRMAWGSADVRFFVDGDEVATLALVPEGEIAMHINHWTSSTWPEVHGPPTETLMCRFDGIQAFSLPE